MASRQRLTDARIWSFRIVLQRWPEANPVEIWNRARAADYWRDMSRIHWIRAKNNTLIIYEREQ